MNYAKWMNLYELRDKLTKVTKDGTVNRSGIPLSYDNDSLYINNNEHHTIVIGATGSGKTQTIILPQMKLSMMANESFVINDPNGEIYLGYKNVLEKNGYNVYALNFQNTEYGNNWNPLSIPYKLYKNGKKDEAQKFLESIGNYLFNTSKTDSSDPFWNNCATQYFIGISLYLFEKANEEEINLNSIYEITCQGEDQVEGETYFNRILKSFPTSSPIYLSLSTTIQSPTETRGGIIAVFKQALNLFISRNNLANMLSSSDFDVESILSEKVAVFLIGRTDTYTSHLEPMFINQLYLCAEQKNTFTGRINILLDEFDTYLPINNICSILNSSRSLGLRFTFIIKSLMDLERQYGKEEGDMLKYTIGNFIYLLSNDLNTQRQICELCGNSSANTPLITIEELKVLEMFEAIVLMPRFYPIRTKLLPDFKIPWPYVAEKCEYSKRQETDIKIYDIKKYN